MYASKLAEASTLLVENVPVAVVIKTVSFIFNEKSDVKFRQFQILVDSSISLIKENFVPQDSFKLNSQSFNNFVGIKSTKLNIIGKLKTKIVVGEINLVSESYVVPNNTMTHETETQIKLKSVYMPKFPRHYSLETSGEKSKHYIRVPKR